MVGLLSIVPNVMSRFHVGILCGGLILLVCACLDTIFVCITYLHFCSQLVAIGCPICACCDSVLEAFLNYCGGVVEAFLKVHVFD